MDQRTHAIQTEYLDGSYDGKTGGTWHLEDAVFKASQVLKMLTRHPEISPTAICDIGSGAGGVLHHLAQKLPEAERLVGFEVSPQALAISRQFETDRCSFVLGDPFADQSHFDLALVLDVVEHVEDCFAFTRSCAAKATWKLFHIPLDTCASMTVRGVNCWDSVGHLHLFTQETALKTIEHCGLGVVDWFLTPGSLTRPHTPAVHITNVGRRLLPEQLGSRLLGGYSIMILAR